jgi:hypothetical protein
MAGTTPGLPLKWGTGNGRDAWTDALVKLIGNSGLPGKAPLGISEFIPQFWTLNDKQKTIAWANIFCMIAYYESSWDPAEVYHEPPPLSEDSIGLLQLSYADGTSYGLTPPLTAAGNGLKDAVDNLTWGVQIATTSSKPVICSLE